MKEAYVEIARIISENDSEVVGLIEEALQNPYEFYNKHCEDELLGELLYSIDIEEVNPKELMGDILLIVLESKNYLCFRDWKDELEDFVFFVGDMVTAKKHKLNPEEMPIEFDEEKDIAVWIYQINNHLKNSPFILAAIDIDSDSYQLTYIKREDFAHLGELIKQIGFELDRFED